MKLEEHKGTINTLLYHIAGGEHCDTHPEQVAMSMNLELFDDWGEDATLRRELQDFELRYIKQIACLSMDDFVPLFVSKIEKLLQAIHDIND